VEAGHEVEYLGLIDAFKPAFEQAWADEVNDLQVLMVYVEILFPNLEAELWVALRGMPDADSALAHCKTAGLLPEEMGLTEVRRWAGNMRFMLELGSRYQPRPVRLTTHLYLSDEDAPADRGWVDLLGERLQITHIGGSHLGIIQQPHVQKLAQAMSGSL
jgi:thioesterase domain-containing protein